MLRARYVLMTLALAVFPVACAPAGCAGEDPEMDRPAEDQWEGVQPMALPAPVPGQPSLYGTWSGDELHVSALAALTLMTDGRYHAGRNVQCIKAPCPPIEENGTYKLLRRDTRTFLELSVQSGVPDRYEYLLKADSLSMRPIVQGSDWTTMSRNPIAWCGGERDCDLQNLVVGPCAGDYVCQTNQCTWTCSQPTETSVLGK